MTTRLTIFNQTLQIFCSTWGRNMVFLPSKNQTSSINLHTRCMKFWHLYRKFIAKIVQNFAHNPMNLMILRTSQKNTFNQTLLLICGLQFWQHAKFYCWILFLFAGKANFYNLLQFLFFKKKFFAQRVLLSTNNAVLKTMPKVFHQKS